MRMMGIWEKMLGESVVPAGPTSICLLSPLCRLPMCFVCWRFSPPPPSPKLLLNASFPACLSHLHAFPALGSGWTPAYAAVQRHPQTRACFVLLFSPLERRPWGKTWGWH